MRLAVILLVMTALIGVASAEPEALDRALDQQRQDQGALRDQLQQQRETQRQQLQQLQDQNLRFQLLQPSRPLICTRVGASVVCQ
jgi:hypothetical protein